jgi:lysophospholipase L1-like esterase
VIAPTPPGEHETAYLLRFTQPERWSPLARHPVAPGLVDELVVRLLDSSPPEVRSTCRRLEEAVATGTEALMRESEYRAAVQRIPFADGETVAAVGDSLTADRVGWFELLGASLRAAGRTAVRTINLAASGDTTADALERLDILAAARPTHVLLMLGTNDARRHGWRRRHRMITARETARNLSALSAVITDELGAALTMITPPPADQRRATAFFAESALGWHAGDIDEIADIVRDGSSDCVDLNAALRESCDPDRMLEADGVHLSPHGQRAATKIIVAHLGRVSGSSQ